MLGQLDLSEADNKNKSDILDNNSAVVLTKIGEDDNPSQLYIARRDGTLLRSDEEKAEASDGRPDKDVFEAITTVTDIKEELIHIQEFLPEKILAFPSQILENDNDLPHAS